MKKKLVWLSYILIPIYILLFVFLFVLGKNILVIAGLWFFIAIPLIPITYQMTIFFSLPDITSQAKSISKGAFENVNYVRGSSITSTKPYLTFELSNGTRKVFKVPIKIFNEVLVGDVGILMYRESGRWLFFRQFAIR